MSAASPPFGLAGSASGWTMSYSPGSDGMAEGGTKLPPAPGPVIAPQPAMEPPSITPDDPSEGVAFALWNEGRREEAIAFLERQIAMQKEAAPVIQPAPQRRFRLPLKSALAAVMLLGIGGALWGGLNPSGPAPDADDAQEQQLARVDDVPAPAAPPKPDPIRGAAGERRDTSVDSDLPTASKAVRVPTRPQ